MHDELQQALPAYLPRFLVDQARQVPSLAGWERRSPAVVLVADLSGFTPLAEALAGAGRRGAEELSTLLNRHFSAMIDRVHACGGDVAQFSGDAISALFSPSPPDRATFQAAAQVAASCAHAIQHYVQETARLSTSQGDFPLQVRVGIGAGPAYAAVLGSRERGLLYLLAGPARQAAARAQKLARPGEIVLSGQACRWAGPQLHTTRTRWGYGRLAAMGGAPLPSAQPPPSLYPPPCRPNAWQNWPPFCPPPWPGGSRPAGALLSASIATSPSFSSAFWASTFAIPS